MKAVVGVVLAVMFVAMYLTWTASRLDRLESRVQAAWQTLDAQLVRRAAAAALIGDHASRDGTLPAAPARALESAALLAPSAAFAERADSENDLTRAIGAALGQLTPSERDDALLRALEAAATRAGFARQFYNDAVRDYLRLRRWWLSRLLRAARRETPPEFFEIADPVAPEAAAQPGPPGPAHTPPGGTDTGVRLRRP